MNNEELKPWQYGALNEWSICGMNHYNVKGEKYLFVSMVKDGKCITEEGKDDKYLWNRLFHRAEELEQQSLRMIIANQLEVDKAVKEAKEEIRAECAEPLESIKEYAESIMYHIDSETKDKAQQNANDHIRHFVKQITGHCEAISNAGKGEEE